MTGASRARRDGSRSAVTSGTQDGLWFLQKLVPESAAYTVCRAYRVDGELDLAALRMAWREVVGRHEVLRTTLVEVDGVPTQRIAAEPSASSFVDLGPVDIAAERVSAHWASTPIDLGEGPVARLVVAEVGDQEHCLLLLLHRAVTDDRSVSIVVDELSAYYAAEVDTGTVRVALPVLSLQYADYARKQRDRARTPEARRLEEWWVEELTPPPAALALPTDRARPVGPSPGGAVVPYAWDDLAGPLHRLAEDERTTPDVVVLAAFQALLWRYGGGDRVAVGLPVSVRPPADYTGLVGPFANPLVLCADLAERPPFADLVRSVAELTGAALRHREVPFARVVKALNPDRDPRRIPLYDAMFVSPQAPESELTLAGTVVRRQIIHSGAVGADLTLVLDRVAPVLAGTLEYRSSLFDPASAAAMLDQLRTLLGAALRDPAAAVDTLPLDGTDRIRAAVGTADLVAAGMAADRPVHDAIREQAERRPDAFAVDWAGEALSYRDLMARADAVTAALQVGGDVRGAAVVVRMPPGPDQLAALLGVLGAGAHLSWFGGGDPGDRGKAVLEDLRPACLLQAGEPAGDPLTAYFTGNLGGRVIALDGGIPAGAFAEPVPVGPDTRAYVAHTSGSTGRPKGIAQTHGALAQFAAWMGAEFGMGRGARVAQWVAPEHDPALAEVFATLVSGGTLCPVPDRVRRNPDKLAGWLAEQRITVLQTVPSFARELLKVVTALPVRDRPRSLDRLLLMGESLPGDLVNGLRAALPAARLVNLYGPTETIAATWHEITDTVHGSAPIGRSIPGRQVLVLDERDRPCATGVTGEIVVRSPHVTPGYVGPAGDPAPFRSLPDLADVGLRADESYRTYRTGDLARRRWDGLLEFRGRKDFQIKLYGNRLELTEVEAALATHDSVHECAAVAVTDRDGLATRLVVYVVPHPGKGGAPDVWRAHLRRRFGGPMLPVVFKTMTERLPRNAGAKVDRRRLPDPALLVAAAARPPRTPVEIDMAALWSELLGVDRVTAEDTVFTAGGHSVLIPRLVDRIRERFGVDLPPWEYFAHPTLAGLSARVEEGGRRDPGSYP